MDWCVQEWFVDVSRVMGLAGMVWRGLERQGAVRPVGALFGELWQALYGALWYVPAVHGLFVLG